MAGVRPLSGVRVIDFGQYIAGPAAAMMLGDLGAEVIRIDPPEGVRWRSPAADMLNRGKACIRLDLKTAAGAQAARDLVQTADVLIENFRPGKMDRLGLGAATMRAQTPGLVYLSLPGFASRDRERASLPAWEAIIAAACGQYSDMGLNRVLMGIEPSFSPLPLASAYGAVLGAGAVTLALADRARSGQGDTIEVPLAAALMEGLAYNSQQVQDYPERYKSAREREIERRRREDMPMDVAYGDLQEFLDPFYRNYRCADGRPFYVVSASHAKHPERVLRLLGLWEDLAAEGLPRHDPYLDVADWPEGADCTLANYPLSPRWSEIVSARMKEAFRAKTAFDWEEAFGAAGAPGAAQRTTREWLASAHARDSGLVLQVEDPDHGRMAQLGNVAWLKSDARAALKKTARRATVPGDIPGRPASQAMPKLQSDGSRGWLAGLKVLDLTNVIAGPTIAATLARFGAEVISIDPVVPTMDPWNAIIFGMQAGRGKRSLLLDLKAKSGRPVLDRLLAWADVVTANATDRQLGAIGLDPEQLRQAYPELILCQLDCYGGPGRGARSNHPGYDDLAQASTGVMLRFGGGLETPEEHAHFGTIDVLGGFCAVLAIGAALVQRGRTGKGDVARASLCAAGQLIQAPFMFDFQSRGPFDEPSGREVKGWGPLYRAYRAADGWFFLAARPDRTEEVAATVGLERVKCLPGDDLEAALTSIFLTQPIDHWRRFLESRDIGIQRLEKMHHVREANLSEESVGDLDLADATFAFVRHDRHPSGRWVDLVAPNAIRPSDAPVRVPSPMPKPGTHSRELLRELGFSVGEIDGLIAEGVVGESWSKRYLPE